MISNGRGSFWGILVGAILIALVPVLASISNNKSLRKAELFLAPDGVTQLVVYPEAVEVAGVKIPYENITFIYANLNQDIYDGASISGETLAGDTAVRTRGPIGVNIGRKIGEQQKRKLYVDGAKSGITVSIGLERKSEIAAPEGMINQLKSLPKRGDDAGRIDIPFGAFLSFEDLENFLSTVYKATGGSKFPSAIVSGIMKWADAQNSACEPRQKIWEIYEKVITAD